jgi:hypothetical protein
MGSREAGGHPLDDFAQEAAKVADAWITSTTELGKRLVHWYTGDGPAGDPTGPLQDLWMTMASSAGTWAELTYKWVQMVDGLSGFTPRESRAPD